MLKFLMKKTPFIRHKAEENLFYSNLISSLEQKEIDRLFARLFSTEDGKKAIAYLQYLSFQRVNSVNSSDAQLRFAEGQRAVVTSLVRLIERGRKG